jgi:hypothetical protein
MLPRPVQLRSSGPSGRRYPPFGRPDCPHPTPCREQECRVSDKVEEVDEPAFRIVGCPLVQLGLHPQYPGFSL